MPCRWARGSEEAHVQWRGVHHGLHLGAVLEFGQIGSQTRVLQVLVRVGLDDVNRLLGIVKNEQGKSKKSRERVG